jgi:hypothetical protein
MKHVLLGTGWMLLAAIPFAWCAENGNEPKVQLREVVEVKRNRVLLSDLLPLDAPPALQKAGAAIDLCQAPQPGSTRILDAGQIRIKLAGQAELLRQLAMPTRITVRYSGLPIAEETVRRAISNFVRAKGWTRDLPDAARLEWSPPRSAVEEHPAVQVTGIDWDSRQQSAQVRLRCSARTSCGSFLVHVFLPSPLGEEWRKWPASTIDLNLPRAGQTDSITAGAVLAERGKSATLILEDGGMRISVRVICLQPGALNQQIRVFDAQSRRVFHAEVVGAGLLHASL